MSHQQPTKITHMTHLSLEWVQRPGSQWTRSSTWSGRGRASWCSITLKSQQPAKRPLVSLKYGAARPYVICRNSQLVNDVPDIYLVVAGPREVLAVFRIHHAHRSHHVAALQILGHNLERLGQPCLGVVLRILAVKNTLHREQSSIRIL